MDHAVRGISIGRDRRGYESAKRCLDVFVALSALIVFGIPMLVIAVLVRLTSDGPSFYRAERLGRHGSVFYQLKFRSMIANAPDQRNPDGSTLSVADDPRVTPLGRFLRRTSLDELPQFINVLTGDMSLVGPRPDPVNVTELYRPQDFNRQSVVQGITGWAIVHGRNEIPWEKRRDLDLEYVEIRSFWLDLKILAMTVGMVLKRRGIHSETLGEST
ncbi:MAG: sugar transferase [bacterium]